MFLLSLKNYCPISGFGLCGEHRLVVLDSGIKKGESGGVSEKLFIMKR
jgi:hypothetical protein